MGGVRGDHSRYLDVSCVYMRLSAISAVSVDLFSPEHCLKLHCMSLHVCLPPCIMGMNPEHCSFALHASDSGVN